MRNKILLNEWRPTPECSTLLQNLLSSGSIGSNGRYTKACEKTLNADYQKWGYSALLTSSCTSALEVAALACSFSPGDEVIVPAFTFPSTVNAVARTGARPVFADVDYTTGNLTPDTISQVLSSATKAVVLVHYAGSAHSLFKIAELASTEKLVLIEDNAHGFGGSFGGQPLGTIGDFGCLSFHSTKNIGCGEGGAVLARPPTKLVEELRENGTNRSAFFQGKLSHYDWQRIGTNAMMSELCASALLGQLSVRKKIQSERHRIWGLYQSHLKGWCDEHEIIQPVTDTKCEHAAHIYALRFNNARTASSFTSYMEAANIQALPHYKPLHMSPASKSPAYCPEECRNSKRLSETLVRLPLHPYLTGDDVDRIIDVSAKFDKFVV